MFVFIHVYHLDIALIELLNYKFYILFFQDELRNTLKKLKKAIDDAERAGKVEQTAKVLEEAKLLIESKKESPFIVATLDAGSNNKVNMSKKYFFALK